MLSLMYRTFLLPLGAGAGRNTGVCLMAGGGGQAETGAEAGVCLLAGWGGLAETGGEAGAGGVGDGAGTWRGGGGICFLAA